MVVALRRVQTRLGGLQVTDRGGAGRPLVLWHDLFLDARNWERVVADLAATRRVLAITGPGHGGSDDPGRVFELEECAGAALDVLADMGVVRAVDWVGNGWGGDVGTWLAATAPERVHSLVVVGGPLPPLDARRRASTAALVGLHHRFGPLGFLRRTVSETLLGPRTRRVDGDAVALVEESFATADRHGMHHAVVSVLLHRPDLADTLARVAVPTLLLAGSDDPTGWHVDRARAAARTMPDGAAAVVAESGHLPPLENPELFLTLVRTFWARLHDVGPD